MKVPKSTRFQAWIALMVFSAVSLASLTDGLAKSYSSRDRWAIAAMSISLFFACVMCLAHFAGDVIIGKGPEGVVGAFLVVWWCAGLATVMNASNGYAVFGIDIINPNLYFAAWGCFIAVVYITGHFTQSTKMVKTDDIKTEGNVVRWYMLLATSIVVLGSSADIMIEFSCISDALKGNTFCNRTKYALSLGCVAGFFSVVSIALHLGGKMFAALELLISFFLFVMYCAGVATITSSTGPGSRLGNLYFSTWLGVVVSLMVIVSVFREKNVVRVEANLETSSPTVEEGEA